MTHTMTATTIAGVAANQCAANALNLHDPRKRSRRQPDMGGKHGGQAGQPRLPPRPHEGEHDEDVVAKRHTGQTDRAPPQTKSK
ncbi:hypothetical protein [Bradyrhizobium sp. DOA9]|uniref:hypothetical protein n=1 Tax=Bradyrhizobium sp. DOA9 TaxID=1126627 RepID=UPI00178C8E5F|nr:hypothetical protein [Bradyrhizobium sp. DOA9]